MPQYSYENPAVSMCFAMSYIFLLETPEIIIPKVLQNYLATLRQEQKKQKGEMFVFPLLLVTGSFNHYVTKLL